VGFEIARRTPFVAREAWARLTDWEAHSGLIPFTIVTRLPGPAEGVGSGFVARTSFGRIGFDDPMQVTFWRPPAGDAAGNAPGVCRIVKQGRVIVGWAVLTVTPGPGTGESTVSWLERADVRRAGPLLRLPNALVGRAVFSRLLDRLLA
jgi:hypothetical protein